MEPDGTNEESGQPITLDELNKQESATEHNAVDPSERREVDTRGRAVLDEDDPEQARRAAAREETNTARQRHVDEVEEHERGDAVEIEGDVPDNAG